MYDPTTQQFCPVWPGFARGIDGNGSAPGPTFPAPDTKMTLVCSPQTPSNYISYYTWDDGVAWDGPRPAEFNLTITTISILYLLL